MTKTAPSSLVRLRLLQCSTFIILCFGLVAAFLSPAAMAQATPPGGPKIWLQANQPLPVQHVPAGAAANLQGLGNGQPVSMAAGDLDTDGFQDLVVGYSTGAGGFIAVHRGNIDAFAPQSDASFQAIGRGEFPSPFQLEAQTFSVPVNPDFIALGDFLGSSNPDLAIASKGGNTLYIFPADGKGNFGAPQAFQLPGAVNAMAAGRFGAAHQPTLVLGLAGPGKKFSLSLYAGSTQGLTSLGAVSLSGPASNILFGDFSDSGIDIAFLSGGNVQILRPNLQLTTVSAAGSVSAFALGSFVYDRTGGQQIALLASNGSIQIAARSDFDPRVYTVNEFQSIRSAKINRLPPPAFVPLRSFPAGWQIIESFSGVGSIGAGQAPVFFQTRISINGADDIMWLNAGNGQMAVISHPDGQPGAQAFLPGQVSVKPYSGSPLAALPMRLNVDGRPGVLAIHQGEMAPSLSEPIPDPNFFVNTDADPTPVSPISNACNNTSFTDLSSSCSLREAVLKANGDTINLQAGHTYSLTIGRGPTQDYSGNTGALYVNHTATIVGGSQSTTVIQWGSPSCGGATPCTVDMVMAVNEDIASTTTATGSLSNLTIQNGVNHGTQSGFDGDGGCMEFDTGTNGTATLTLTNVTLQNCSTLQGGGGGLVIFNSVAPAGAGGVTISNSIFQNNSVVSVGAAGNGGAIAIAQDAHMTMTASQVKNNSAVQNCTPTCGLGDGGGILAFNPQTVSAATAESFIHSSTISGNKAAGFGGGINTSASISIDTGTVISGNIAGTDGSNNTAHANEEGGGLYLNPLTTCPSSSCTATLSKVTITGNTATGNGGGISYGNGSAGTVGALSMSFSRLAGNTTSGGLGSNLSNNHGTGTVTDNWWGTNAASSTINTISGTTTFDPFIVLSNTPNPNPIKLGQTTTLTASFLQDNHGTPISAGNLNVLLGLPLAFSNPIDGTLSNAEAAIQPVSIASATESGSTVTITTTITHGYAPGETVVIAGVGVAGYNGTFTIAATPTTTTFTYTDGTTGLANSSGGTASVGAAGTATATFQSTLAGTGHADATVDTNPGPTVTANITIQKGDTTTSLISSVNPTVFGQSVTFTATVSPVAPAGPPTTVAPTGTVTFLDGGSPIGTGTVNSVTGIATFTTSALAVGNHTITSSYGGDSNYNGSTGSLTGNPQVVNKADTTTTVTSSANPSVFSQSVTFTATVSAVAPGAGTPTGTVTFLDGGSPIGTGTLSGGIATFTTSALSVGNHTITTNYGGDGNFNGSTGSLTGNPQVVNKADTATTVTSSANPSVFGQSVTFTATVSPVAPGSGTPVGTVTFLDGGSPIGTGTLSGGIATFTTSALAVGNHTITTNYGGDGNFNGSTGSLTGNPQVVNKADTTTTVTSSTNPSVFGQSVTFTATVSPVAPGSGTPTGTVTFLDGGSPIGTGTLSGGIATFATSALTTGNHTITTSYGGDGNFNGSTGSLTGNPQVVNKANTSSTVTSSVNPSVFGQSVTFTATLSPVAPGAGTPTGTVTFLDGGSPIGTGTLSGGIATFTTSALAIGNHTITTSYGGDGNFNGSTGSLTGNPQVVNKADTTTTVTSSANPSVFGQSVTFTATVSPVAPGSGTPTGTVTFLDGGSPIGTGTLSGGIATFTTSALAIGNHTITTSYGGDGNFNGSTGSLTGNPQVVNKANTSTTVTSSANPSAFGQSVTFTSTVSPVAPGSGTPTGTVTFLDGGSPIGTGTLSGGIATFATSALASGNHTITTNYGGDGNFNGSTGSLTGNPQVVLGPPSIAKAFNPNTIALNATTSLTFTITNPNTSNALNGVAFTDTLPTGLTVASSSSAACGGTLTTTNPRSISLSGATINGNSNCQFAVTVTGAVSGQYTNTTGAVSSTNGGTGNTASANLTVASPPTINKSFNPTTIVLNANSTLSFTITNPNTGVALSGVAFTDTLPSGVQVAATPNVTGSCGSGTITATPGSGSISLSGGTLTTSPAAGSSCTFSADVTGTTAGLKNNSVTVTSTEGGTGNTSNASLTVTAASTSTAVASSLNPSVFGQSVTFTATVTNSSAGSTGAPTGSVQFVVDGVNFGSPVALTGASSTSSTATSAAIATLSVAGSPHTVSANYTNADGNFTNSTGSLAGGQTITLAITNTAVLSSSNPSVFGQSVTFTATVADVSAGSTAQPTGSVQFVVDGVNFGAPVTLTGATSSTSAATSQATASLSIGGSPHSVAATYVNADGNFSNSTGSLSGGQVVTQANTTTTVISSAGTITLGDTVTFTATVTVNSPGTGTPTGLATFFDGTTPLGSGPLNGSAQATFSTAVLSAGSHSITAIYDGDADFTASPLSSPITETVNLRGTTTSVALNPTTVGAGQASTTTVTVTDGSASIPPGTPDVFSATGAPATGRTGFTATLIGDGIVLVAGGTAADGTTVLQSAEVYNGATATFILPPGSLNTARTGAVAVLLPNGKVLVAGGSSTIGANGALNSAELFDPRVGTFSPTSHNMTVARFGATATLLNNGQVLLAGGANSGGVSNTAELYDPVADTFTATGNLSAARTGASATLLGTGKVLVAGGSSNGGGGGALNSAELFDPGAGSFTSVAGANPTLATGRWQPAATLLSSGKVLVAGGQNSGGPLASADLYDPVADSFTATAHQMIDARANGSAVTLPNGMVLLPGGTTSQAVDLYDADSDRFDSTGSLLNHNTGLVATLLNNGRVLVVGLANGTTSDAELYSPSFNPLGTVGFSSSEPTDVFGPACVLAPSTTTASVCTSTVTPAQVATSPHTITGTYPADAVHSGSSNSASLTVIPTAPPTIAKAFGASNVAQNGTVGVSFTIVNPNAAATLTGISFTDALPAGLVVATPNNLSSNCGGTVTAVAGSSSISLTGGTVAPAGPAPVLRFGKTAARPAVIPASAASGQCVVSLNLLVTGTGTISNTTGPVSANESGPGNPSNTATLNVVLAPTANKAFGAASIPVSGTTSLTFNIANPNTATTLVGITFTDTLPSGLVVATPNGLTGSCVASSLIGATPGSNSINLSALNLAASGSCSFSVNVTGTSGGTKNNTTSKITGTFDDGSGTFVVATGGTASASIVVVAPPVIGKAFVPAAIAPNGVSTLTFTITNPAANSVAETGVAFTDTLPTNVVIATPNGLSGSCGGTVTATAGTGAISLTGGSIAATTSCVISVNVTSSITGTYTNTTGAVSSTNGGTGNTATAVLSVAPASLSITKTHVANFPRNSTGNNYTITVSNAAGAGPTLGTVTVTDTLPAVQNTLVATALSGSGWTCTLNTLTCTRSDVLAPGASYPAITLTVTVPPNIQSNVTNSATVSGGGDPNSHTANDPTHIGPPIIITSMDSGSATVLRGNPATFLFQVDTTGVVPQPAVVAFSCSGLPTGSACIFGPLATGQPVSQVTLTITTLGNSNSASVQGGRGIPPTYAALLFPVLGLVGIGLAGAKRKNVRLRLVMMFAGLLVLAALAGCGGNALLTARGQSTITVTATAASATGPVSGSTTVALTVQ